MSTTTPVNQAPGEVYDSQGTHVMTLPSLWHTCQEMGQAQDPHEPAVTIGHIATDGSVEMSVQGADTQVKITFCPFCGVDFRSYSFYGVPQTPASD